MNPVEITVMVGVSGSGKSTYIEKGNWEHQPVCSTDQYIEQHGQDYGFDNYTDAFADVQAKDMFSTYNSLFFYDMHKNIFNGINFIVDRTNLTVFSRKKLISYLKNRAAGEEKIPVKIKCVVFKSTFEQVMKNLSHRNEQTGKSIPQHIVEQQFTSFEMPTMDEGFDEIIEVELH
ncbi:ATP-binding protein [bacterium]|nr:ATP-binding protein [bacterium]